MPLPIPRLAPVTTATLPSSEPAMSDQLRLLRGGLRLAQHQAGQVALGAPVGEHRLKGLPARQIAAEQRPLGLRLPVVVEVAGGAFAEEARSVELVLPHV